MQATVVPVPERIHKLPAWLNTSPLRPLSSASTLILCSSSGQRRRRSASCSSWRSDYEDDDAIADNRFGSDTSKTNMLVNTALAVFTGAWHRLRLIKFCNHQRLLGLVCVILVATTILVFDIPSQPQQNHQLQRVRMISTYEVLRPLPYSTTTQTNDPEKWLTDNSDLGHRSDQSILLQTKTKLSARPRAALISVVRNSELAGIMQSMTQLEYRWNWYHKYPWIFFNDEPFTQEFKEATRNLTQAEVYYELIPKEHWSMPEWVDESRFLNSLEFLGAIGVGKGWMVSYHNMCRWNSGFFYKHSRLADYDWYWRVEPDVHFFCDMVYDPFKFMANNKLIYGFNMLILDDARSFPSLWEQTRAFIAANPQLLHPEADLSYLLDGDSSYNNCQFFSNFEIGSLNFWRKPEVQAYFEWLDRSGGFYYERWGDAPVHTLALAMFTSRREIWFYRDVGYQHDINSQCPPRREGMCSCQETGIDANFYKLVPRESRQKRPADTCIRSWLGGEWLIKRDGWNQEVERTWGGDGYQGYMRWK